MNAVENEVYALMYKELESANTRFPAFRSEHEGWAVLREEADELNDEVRNIDYILDEEMWESVKHNDLTCRDAKQIQLAALRAACEAIQVAAMARKYLDMLELMGS